MILLPLSQVNQFVKKLVSVMDEAGSYVHGEPIKVRSSREIPLDKPMTK